MKGETTRKRGKGGRVEGLGLTARKAYEAEKPKRVRRKPRTP